MKLEWIEFFPNFYEAKILDKLLIVNWNTPDKIWEFYVGTVRKYRSPDPTWVFAQAQSWANHYYRENVRIK